MNSMDARAGLLQVSYQAREDREVFYSKPTEAVISMFTAIQQILDHRQTLIDELQLFARAALVSPYPRPKGGGSPTRLLLGLTLCVQAALMGAGQQHSWHVRQFAVQVELSKEGRHPAWVAANPVRTTLLQLSQSLAG